MASQRKSIANFFCRHLVGLSVLVRERSGGKREQGEVLSCFVMEVGDRWFLITAGHCVDHLRAVCASAKFQKVEFCLYDGWTSLNPRTLIPFNFAELRSYSIDLDDLGIDIGVIEIDPLLRRTLEKGGIVALGPSLWRSVPEKLQAHVLVGQPSELLRPRHVGGRLMDLTVDPVALFVKECEAPESMVKLVPRFYAKVPDEIRMTNGEVLDDIAGMSGGPIFGFQERPDGQLVYYLVAVQGSWSTKHRVIAAAPAWLVGEALSLAVASGKESALAEMFDVSGRF